MLTYSVDEAAGAAVWLFSGPSNSDADFEHYVASLKTLREKARAHGGGVGLLVTTPGNPPPNAAWRKRMADASRDFPPNCVFVMVSESVVVRGVVTAINWLRPATYEFIATATLEEGFSWLRTKRDGATVKALEDMLAAVRERVGKAP